MSKQMVVAALAAVATAVAWGEGAVKPLKVMMIGNSYSGSAFRQTPVVAEGDFPDDETVLRPICENIAYRNAHQITGE